MNSDNDRIKRIEDFLLDPERALFTTLEEFRTAVDEMLPVIRAIDIAKLQTLKGEDGRTPQRGTDYMTADDISALEAFILSKMPQTDVDYPSVQATESFIKFELAKIPRIKGDRGEPGTTGTPGKDGSPDTAPEILRKLRTLGRNQGLQIDDIRGLENRLKVYNTAVDELAALTEEFNNRRVVIPANVNGGGSTPSGSGDVVGPASSVNNRVAFFDGLTGKLIKDSGLTLSGTNTGDQVGDGTTITGAGTPGDPFVAIAAVGSVAWGAITGTLSAQTDLQAALDAKASSLTADQNYVSDAQLVVIGNTSGTNTGDQNLAPYLLSATAASTYEPLKGANDNYVTDAQLIVIGNTSGTNTGDQTSIVGITGTLAQFNTALTGADFATGGGTASGTNTGDQTSIVGITGTIAQFNTAVTDADLATLAGVEVLTNKVVAERVITTTDDATAVIDVTLTDVYELTAVANATTFSTTGTPRDGQRIIIRFKDAGVAKALTWDAIFVVVGVTLPTTTVAGKWHYVGVKYNSSASAFHVLAVGVQA